jgi:transcriptional regulator with XRE-family HTH domain
MAEAELLAMGARIQDLRAASGLGQKTVADYCGVELRTYQFWQQGKHPPGGERLQKLSELFRSRGLDYATESYILRGPALAEADSVDVVRELAEVKEQLRQINAALVMLSASVLVVATRRDIARVRRQLGGDSRSEAA